MKNDSKIIVCILIGMIIIAILFPLSLDYFIFSNDYESQLTNSEWAGFLGSFFGGIIGGLGTLVAVYFTTKETRYIQRENEKNEKKQYINSITETISIFVSEIKFYTDENIKYSELVEKKNRLSNRNTIIKEELKNIKSDNYFKDDKTVNKKIILEKEQNEIETEIYTLNKNIESLSLKYNSISESYFKLKIYLDNIDEASELLKSIEFLNDFFKNNIDNIELDNLTNKIFINTINFSKLYIK